MKQFILKNKKAVNTITFLLVIAVITLSFQDTPYVNQVLNEQKTQLDTFPSNRQSDVMTMKQFNEIMEALNIDLIRVGEELKKMDLTSILDQVHLSMKAVDMDKILKDVDASIKQADLEKIQADVENSLKEINFVKGNVEIQDALKNAKVEMEKARIEMGKVDRALIRKEMENVRAEIEKSSAAISKINVDKITEEVNDALLKANADLKQIKIMFDEMEKDGLIRKKDGFKIEYKKNDFFINGKKQDQSITDKYRKYFKEDNFEIKIEKE